MFANRKKAGISLGKALKKYSAEHPLLLAIPRGGVEIAYYVAQELQCGFHILVAQKLGHPRNREAAIGAIAEDDSLYLDPRVKQMMSKQVIEEAMAGKREEIARRIDLYRQGKPLPDLQDRTVIVVDDGIATGSTLFAAVLMCKKQHPETLVVAAPVSGIGVRNKLEDTVDDVVILETPRSFFAVSQAYEEFGNLTDQEVLSFLDLNVREPK
ncbi:MAG: phosphoribosyltransferase family protein [Balneolaceae bacterium]|nr:phosphoribosyltransferase family protein [Balneolaceae bacterium]